MRRYLIRRQPVSYKANVVHVLRDGTEQAMCSGIVRAGKNWRITDDVKDVMVCGSCALRLNKVNHVKQRS